MTYEFKTKPFDHQLRVFNETKDTKSFAIFWEQGTGKSKLTLDTVGHLYDLGKIDCLFVIAPNGVHRNWTAEEVGNHWTDELLKKVSTFTYHASKAKTKYHQKDAQEILTHKGLAVIAMSYDAFITEAGKKFAKLVLTKRRCMFVLDESARIKNHKAQRTRVILAASKYAEYKRILTGTPVSNGPFDVFAQMKFLFEAYWKQFGLNNYTMFKNYFATWHKVEINGRSVNLLKSYQNLDYLHKALQPHSSRVLKKDVLDLPPKLYSKRYFTMSSKQAKLYETLRKDFIAEFDELGGTITADLAITRMLRLSQIACGYVTVEREVLAADGLSYDIDKEVLDIDKSNARIATVLEILEDLPHKAIIWAKFTRDIDMLMKALGNKAVRFDGKCSVDEKAHAVDSFQHGKYEDAQFFVANAQAAGTGLTLHKAKTVIYNNNTFRLEDRLQSEDRPHRIGMDDNPVHYIDIAAENTIDDKVIDALRSKLSVASQITGDGFKEWL
jgi:SNF2 family DNA or RNA helicase